MILDPILAATALQVERDKRRAPASQLRELLASAPAPRPFAASIRANVGGIIAEFKRRSPSGGELACRTVDPVATALAYQRGGAAAISVLTEAAHFAGTVDDLRRIRRAVQLPVLRKDFVIDPYQLLEARAAGADAVLLVARVLRAPVGASRLAAFIAEAEALHLEALVEVHDERDVADAVAARAHLIGINNRNLDTLAIDLDTVPRIARCLPLHRAYTVVAESGMRSAADVRRLRDAGAHGMLIGEMLMRSTDAARTLADCIAPQRLAVHR